MLKFVTPTSLKTWKATSWIVQSLSRLGDMELQKCNISKLGMPSLQTKGVRFQTCGCQVLTIMFTCVHVLGDQIMKDIIRGKGLMLKFFAPKGFKTWEGKCGKFLNHFLRNLIFTLWGQILQCTIRKLHNAHPYRFGLPNLDGCYTWYRCQLRGMSWKIVTFQNLGCQVLKNNHRVHALDVHSLWLAKTSCKQFQDWGSQVLKMAWCHEIPHCVFCKRHVQAYNTKRFQNLRSQVLRWHHV